MAVDNAPAQNAQNLLNGIDYSALIGGPLQAAITAQAMAAKSTWEFIKEVGLQTDADGNKSAVNVSFLYQKDGEMMKLIVPILTIVPIPCIMIDEIDIAFKANINAAASSTTEDSSSEEMAGELEAEGKVGWGPFSLTAKVKASYSSKKDSKATQDSSYSVEYTQDVHVHASQAGVPAGLSTILNILSSAATGASRDGEMFVNPPVGALAIDAPKKKQNILIRLTDSNGLLAKGSDVVLTTVDMEDPNKESHKALSIGQAPIGRKISWDSDSSIKLKTNPDGTLSLMVWVDEDNLPEIPDDRIIELKITSTIGKDTKDYIFPIRVNGDLAVDYPKLAFNKSNLDISKGGEATDKLTVYDANEQEMGDDVEVTVTFSQPDLTVTVGAETFETGEQFTVSSGKAAVKFDLADTSALQDGETIPITFTSTVDEIEVETVLTLDVINTASKMRPVSPKTGTTAAKKSGGKK